MITLNNSAVHTQNDVLRDAWNAGNFENLSYSQFKYKILEGDSNEIVEIKINKFIQKWYNASNNNISTSKKLNLCKKTRSFISWMKISPPDVRSKIALLICKAIDEHGEEESEKLALWLKQNTIGYEVDRHENRSSMFRIFNSLGYISNPVRQNGNFKKIIEKAKNYIDTDKPNFSVLGDNLPKILENLELEDLLNFHQIEEYRSFASYELVRRLKKGEFYLTDIIQLNEDSKKNIQFLFGDYCSNIQEINLNKNPNVISDKIHLNFIDCVPNLKHVNIEGYYNLFFSIADDSKEIDRLSIKGHCSKFDSTNLNKVKELDLNCTFSPDSLKISSLCPNIEVANLRLYEVSTLSYLQFLPNLTEFSTTLSSVKYNDEHHFIHCPKLKKLTLTNCSRDMNINFLQYLPNLESLSLGSYAITDADFFNILAACPNLKTIIIHGECLISDKVLRDTLKTRDIELLTRKWVVGEGFVTIVNNGIDDLDLENGR